MTGEQILLRFLCMPGVARLGLRLVHRRHWAIEAGAGAGLRFRVSHNLDYIRGTNELPVQEAIASRLQPSAVFYDVGANLGFFSMIAARLVGPSGQVCAFEPLPENLRLIRENAAANGFTHIQAFETAVGAKSGTTDLFLADWKGGATIAAGARPPDAAGKLPVPLVSLDDALERWKLRPPDFVKIDVEGAEAAVLEGMQGILRRYRPTVLYEVDDGDERIFQEKHRSLDARMAAYGYRIERIVGAYPGTGWHVGHSLALPCARAGQA